MDSAKTDADLDADNQKTATIGHTNRLPTITNKFIFVLGGPGAGKGTLCTEAADKATIFHVCVGDLLRVYQKRKLLIDSEAADELKSTMASGKLMPFDTVLKVIREGIRDLDEAYPYEKTIILDGFPRNHEQTGMVLEIAKKAHIWVYNFVCDRATLLKRVLKRGLTSGRVDDNPETFNKRMDSHEQEIAAILEKFSQLVLPERIVNFDTSDLDDLSFVDVVRAIAVQPLHVE